jgi:hypothetical protein
MVVGDVSDVCVIHDRHNIFERIEVIWPRGGVNRPAHKI